MEDIELVIKIQKAYYELVIKRCKDPVLLNAFKNGTPLPKGHGRIIDESQVTGTFIWDNGYIECYAPTIIEADVPKRRKGIPLEENDSGYNCENWIP